MIITLKGHRLYRVGSIIFYLALISCLRGKFTGWLVPIPKTHKTITNVIQSVFTQLMSFRFSDRHEKHTVSLFWIIVFKATWLCIWFVFCEFISEQILTFFLSYCVKYLIESVKITCLLKGQRHVKGLKVMMMMMHDDDDDYADNYGDDMMGSQMSTNLFIMDIHNWIMDIHIWIMHMGVHI